MDKTLSEMTIEELWELFPIILAEHNPCWSDWFEEERLFLQSLLPHSACINHIGSTAINHIWAKPIIDILVELQSGNSLPEIKEKLVRNGYLCMYETKDRISLNKGYTEHGFAERVFHIHLRKQGDHDELFFKDYLNSHPVTAKEYESLKFSLWKTYEHDRDGYTNAKTDFIQRITMKAKASMDQQLEIKSYDWKNNVICQIK